MFQCSTILLTSMNDVFTHFFLTSYEIFTRSRFFFAVFCQPRVRYAFESLSKREVFDDSGFDNNGVIYGNIKSTRHGKCGNAGKFRNGYIYLRNFRKTKTSGIDAILISFWVKINNPRSTTSLFRGYYKGNAWQCM